MKNIFWISSYPKSGNTFIRLFLATYFFTKEGRFTDFNFINNIGGFNNFNVFNKIKNFCGKDALKKEPRLISNYWIEAQETLYKLYPKKVFFFKTHNAFVMHNKKYFTNEVLTRGIIYIVRDPRSILVSAKYHYNYPSYETGLYYLCSDRHISLTKDNILPEFLLSWKQHYLSWKEFIKKNPKLGIIIKYEDLISDPNKTLLKVLKFVKNRHKIEIDNNKFDNTINSIQFKNLQKKESEFGFIEKGPQSKKFFRKGLVDEWKQKVPVKIIEKLEKKFNNEMMDLGYLENE